MSGRLSGLRLVAVLVISSLLEGAHTQTSFPHIVLRGTILRNNSWIDVKALTGGNKLYCMTDLDSCCEEGTDQRSWILPKGIELSKDGVQEIASYIVYAEQRQLALSLLDLRPVGNTALPGVYECSIATRSAAAESVYVGIYHDPVDIGETRVCIQTVIRCHDELPRRGKLNIIMVPIFLVYKMVDNVDNYIPILFMVAHVIAM